MKTSTTPGRFLSASKFSFLLLFAFSAFILVGFVSCEDAEESTVDENEDTESASYYAFRNSVNAPPSDWDGPVFELSDNYPTTLPDGGDDMPWMKINVDFNDKNPDWTTGAWKEYINAIIEYAFEGQDPNLSNESGWKSNVGGKDMWFHVPWMAYSTNAGREFIHGCTSERIASIGDFDGPLASGIGMLQHSNDDASVIHFETWAVGMYNEYAGYAFSELFPESGVPALGSDGLPKGLPFPNGSCVIKTLFTTATQNEVPFLKNAPTWTVNRHVMEGDTTYTCERKPQAVHLVQVDVAVVDPRSPSNWVFGTFAYNGTLDGETALERLDPVGIQFANDPTTFPAVPMDESVAAYQSVLNNTMDIYEHFGCHGRLCGPVDNPQASCMSCHGGSYTAPMDQMDEMGTNIPAIFGFDGMCDTNSLQNIAFFSNRKYPEPYYPGMYPDAIPLDFSLQVQVAFTQYKIFKIQGYPSACKPTTP
ncbi:MAG: hypothetical protein P8P74_16530 [Crocinitomicaceae bacterium]|nr:hypothetical protein [Crocinitomicaceae bacterium]